MKGNIKGFSQRKYFLRKRLHNFLCRSIAIGEIFQGAFKDMNKYFGYSHISTENQSQNSVEEQLEFLQGQAQNLGLPFESIIEKQSTKDISGRKELVNLLSKVQDQDIVGFKYQDRLGRETEEDLILLRELSEKNIRVHVNGQFVDYKDPTQKFTFTTLSAVATFQRELQKLKALQVP